LNTYGTLDNPFPELPPAASLASVHWQSGLIKWATAPFARLECSPAHPPLGDSMTGTLSVWVRCNGTMPGYNGFDTRFDVHGFVVVATPGPRIGETVSATAVPDIGLYIWIDRNNETGSLNVYLHNRRAHGGEEAMAHIGTCKDFELDQSSISADLIDDAWAHFLIAWDWAEPTATIIVNKIASDIFTSGQSSQYASPGTEIGPYFPVAVPWGTRPRFFRNVSSTSGSISDPDTGFNSPLPPTVGNDSFPADYMLSYANVWVSTKERITDAALFVSDENTPARLEEGHAVTFNGRTIKPDFYFRGAPNEFIKNNGAGGEATLIGSTPIAQSVPVKIGE
jgi:hypothetical protein